MTLRTIHKLGGFALIAGSVLFTAYAALWPSLLPVSEAQHDFTKLVLDPNWSWLAWCAFAGVVLMMFGFAAVYSRFYAEAGVTGLLGVVFIELAYLLQACKVTWEIFLYPIMARDASAVALLRDGILRHHSLVLAFRTWASATILAGIVLFCLALVRSRQFSRLAGILIFVGALVYALGPVLSILVAIGGILILSVGCLILGLRLMSQPSVAGRAQP
jgi:hypothetical protein